MSVPRCLFGLHEYCIVLAELRRHHKGRKEILRQIEGKWGSPRWIHTYCSMCMKAAYARSKLEGKYKVVNTL